MSGEGIEKIFDKIRKTYGTINVKTIAYILNTEYDFRTQEIAEVMGLQRSTIRKFVSEIEDRRADDDSILDIVAWGKPSLTKRPRGRPPKKYVICFPNGERKEIENLTKFCLEHKIDKANLWQGKPAKGYSLVRKDDDDE